MNFAQPAQHLEFLRPAGPVLAEVRTERRFELTAMPENWAAVLGLVLLIGLCWWIVRNYRREARAGSSTSVRMLMASLRCSVILLLALIWLEPVLATYLHHHTESYTILLIDGSESIKIKDTRVKDLRVSEEEKRRLSEFLTATRGGDPGQSNPLVGNPQTGGLASRLHGREELIQQILSRNDSEFLRELTSRNRLKIYTFSDRTIEIATLKANRTDGVNAQDGADDLDRAAIHLRHEGKATNLGQTLRHAVDSLDGPLAAVVVISDGGFNQGEQSDVLGQFARARNFPIYAIGVGDPLPPANVRVASMKAPPSAFVKDPFQIEAQIEVTGKANQSVTVELSAKKSGSAADPTILERKTIEVTPEVTHYSINFEHRSQTAGRFEFQIAASAELADTITQDNSRQLHVSILDNQIRVLIISGGPSWTYRFLSRLLQRDDAFDLSCWLQSADRTAVRDGNTVIDHLPETAAELYQYDVIVLLDADASQIPAEWAELVDTHVSTNAAGFLYSAARQRTPAFFRHPTAKTLIKLLPIAPDPEADLILNEVGYYQRQGSPIFFPPQALDNPIFSAGADSSPQSQADFWRRVSKVYWHYPVKHEKPAATVLMRHGHPRMRNSYGEHVLLATQFVGSGRSMFVGFDGTWRWRRYSEDLFDRFWIQTLRYLAEGRLMDGQPGQPASRARGRIHTDRDRYDVGEPITLRARLTDRNFEALTRPSVTMHIALEGSGIEPHTVVLKSDEVRSGWYEGQFVPQQAGTYLMTILLLGTRGGEDLVTISRQVSVRRSNLEILKPEMDQVQLTNLAQQSAGGAFFTIDQAMAVPGMIPDRHETTITKEPSLPLWDTGWMLALLAGLLCLEWALRKKYQLL